MRATAAGPAPANPHRRAGATRTTEQEGGRVPHDPPVTTARSEVTEGGCQVRWGPQGGGPRAAPHPPHPGAALQPRTASARRKGAHRRRGESQEGVPQAAAWNESREAAARHPPPPHPPPPHRPASRRGPGPHPPRLKGRTPPPERGAGVRPAPTPQPPAPMGAAKSKWAHACAPGRRADRAQRSRVGANRNGMGGHAPHGQHDAKGRPLCCLPGESGPATR